MQRYLNTHIQNDLTSKIVLLMGPRQCGKTTLSKQLVESYDYFNYDLSEDRIALSEKAWDRNKQLIIFDEIHKMEKWKRWLKGIYDTEGIPPQLIVTGSAKLDTYRKVGDSLAGRYFQYRLHPLDMKEAYHYFSKDKEDIFQRLLHCSGFPEPFLNGKTNYYQRWRRTHLDIILRQDLIDQHTVKNIQAIETLVFLLKKRVGSTISFTNLANDLGYDIHTIKRWLQWLENLYVIFRVSPYHRNIARSLLKESKYYFYDIAQVDGNEGVRLENLVACALLKELHYIEDTTGLKTSLHFLRTKEGKEIDFLIVIDEKPTHMIEVKWADDNPADGFKYFSKYLQAHKIQLVRKIKRNKTFPDGLQISNVVDWLASISLNTDSNTE